jgi:hypothetical protein
MSGANEVAASEIEAVVTSGDAKYRITGHSNRDSFVLKVVNENLTDRWTSTYSAGFIDEITQKAGCAKRITVFWKMLADAATRESQSVTLEILTEAQIQQASRSRTSGESEDRLFVLLTQSSEYDCFRYPLPIKRVPFTRDECLETISLLYEDNRRMHETITAMDCAPAVLVVEQKLAEYMAMVDQMREQLEAERAALKKKVRRLKQKLAQNPWHVPPPQLKLA